MSGRWDSTPLCPAGHLPLKGGDWLSRRASPIAEGSPLSCEMGLGASPPRNRSSQTATTSTSIDRACAQAAVGLFAEMVMSSVT
ncbi:hypothetical protein FJ980_04035 [Mesorhizobium sp. B1-1-5]|nr:hypothetical protein FJ980_04035 [Mesorhizobium sp. B1-1-5]